MQRGSRYIRNDRIIGRYSWHRGTKRRGDKGNDSQQPFFACSSRAPVSPFKGHWWIWFLSHLLTACADLRNTKWEKSNGSIIMYRSILTWRVKGGKGLPKWFLYKGTIITRFYTRYVQKFTMGYLKKKFKYWTLKPLRGHIRPAKVKKGLTIRNRAQIIFKTI
jgi:hypothetical protein